MAVVVMMPLDGYRGDNITVPESVDQGKNDHRNVTDLITDCNENDMYRITVKTGILQRTMQ